MKTIASTVTTIKVPKNIIIRGNESIDDLINKLLFVKGENKYQIVVLHRGRVICPLCKTMSNCNGHQIYGPQTYICGNEHCKHLFVPNDTIPGARHSMSEIIKGVKCVYKGGMSLRKASVHLKTKGVNISHHGIRGWKRVAPDILRALLNSLKPESDNKSATDSIKSIKKSLSWLRPWKRYEYAKVSTYTPRNLPKDDISKHNVIESRKKDGKIQLMVNKSFAIEMSEGDKLTRRIIMALLNSAKLGSPNEIAKALQVAKSTVSENTKKYLEGGSDNLISKSGGSESKLTPEVKGYIISELIESSLKSEKVLNQIIVKKVNEKILDNKNKISYKTVERFRKDINFDGIVDDLKAFIELISHSDSHPRKPSRYALELLTIPLLEKIGFYETMEKISLDRKIGYPDVVFYHTLYFLFSIGKTRLYHLSLIPHNEFGQIIGLDGHISNGGAHKRMVLVAKKRGSVDAIIEAIRGYSKADIIDGTVIYIDTHVIQLWINGKLFKTLHGTKKLITKAINAHYAHCAKKDMPITFIFTQANKSLKDVMKDLIEQVNKGLVDEKKVRILIADRGIYKISLLLEICKEYGILIITWGKRGTTAEKEVKRLSEENACFEYFDAVEKKDKEGNIIKQTIEYADEVITVNAEGDKIRTIILRNASEGKLKWLHVVGEGEKEEISTNDAVDYLLGKQSIENLFKEKIKHGGFDEFCGGELEKVTMSEEMLEGEELEKHKKRLEKIEERIKGYGSELKAVKDLLDKGKISKRTYNASKKDFNRLIRENTKEKKRLDDKIKFAEGGKKPEEEYKDEVDTTRMEILNLIKDYALNAKKLVIKEFIEKGLKPILLEEANEEALNGSGKNSVEEIYEKKIKYFDKNKDMIRSWLFDIGGYIKTDEKNKIKTITPNEFDNKTMRKAYNRYTTILNEKRSKLRCGEGVEYTLIYKKI